MDNYLNLIRGLAATVVVSVLTVSTSAADECKSTTTFSSSELYQEIAGYDYKTCSVTPNGVKIKLFAIGLCKSAPTVADQSACTNVFVSESGTEVELTTSTSITLQDDISLDEGVYTNAYILLATTFGTKATMVFSTPREASDGTLGKVCYSNGPYDETSGVYDNVSCGSTGQAIYSWETLKVFPENKSGIRTYNALESFAFPGSSNLNNLYQLDSSRALSTVTVHDGTDFVNMATVDRPYIMVDQAFAAPVSILPTSTSLDLAISVTNAAEFGFTSDTAEPSDGYVCPDNNGINGDGCVADVVFSGLQLIVTVE
jgi:hypothetical protein